MTDNNETSGVSQRAEEFLQVFKKGAEFTQSLLKENERLRYRVLEVEQQLRSEGISEVTQLRERLQQSEEEKQEVLDRIHSVEQENLGYANRYAEIEAENNLLANLYITTYQLHSTFDVNEILRIIEEILLNLVGADRFSLFLREADGKMLQPLLSTTGEPRIAEVVVADARVLSVVDNRQAWVADPAELSVLSEGDAKAVIPLQVDNDLIGVLAIYHLLEQKSGFSEIDDEIFSLLGGHAAMALCTALLRRETDGTMNFRQSFMTQV